MASRFAPQFGVVMVVPATLSNHGIRGQTRFTHLSAACLDPIDEGDH